MGGLYPVQIVAVLCYLSSALFCIWFLISSRLSRAQRLQVKSLKFLYSTNLLICFIFRGILFATIDAPLSNIGYVLLVSVGFVFLIFAKLFALLIWHQCGVAFVAATAAVMKRNVLRSQRLIGFLIGFLILQFTAISLWMMRDAGWKLDAVPYAINASGSVDFIPAFDVLLNWFGIVNLLFGLASLYLGGVLYFRTRKHAFQNSAKIVKLKYLSWMGGFMFLTFIVRGAFDLQLIHNETFNEYCVGDHRCWIFFFLGTEWVPNFFMQVVLVLLARMKDKEFKRKSANVELSMTVGEAYS